MNEKIASAKKFVAANKTKMLVTATVVSLTAVVVQQIGLKQHNDFLKDHDLYEEYYADEEE